MHAKSRFLWASLLVVGALVGCGGEDDPPSSAAGSGGSQGGGSGGAGQGGSAAGAGQAGSGQAGSGQGGAGSGQGGEAGGAGGEAGGEGGQGGEAGGAAGGGQEAVKTSAECGAVPILGPQGPATTDECAACMQGSCCAEGEACGKDAECVAYRGCAAGCTTQACLSKCDADHPEGIKASTAFAQCRNSKCSLECRDLACLGSVGPWSPAPTYKVTLTPLDFQTNKAVPGVTVKQCHRDDTGCASPVDTQTTDASGAATFASVPTGPEGFSDYFELSEPSYQTTLSFDLANDRTPTSDARTYSPLMVSTATWKLLTGVISVQADPERGHAAALVLGCGSGRLPGVSVSASTSDDATTTAYIAGSIPSKTATETDSSGIVSFLNLPPGPLTLEGQVVSSGAKLGASSVFVRAGCLSITNVIPMP